MSTPDDVAIRRPADHELEDVLRLRWLWNTVDRDQSPAMTEQEFVSGGADWARAHAQTHIPHAAFAADGAIIGMAWLALTPRVASTTGFDRVSGDLQSCYVRPAHRGHGIGGRLVRAVIATAHARGAEHVTVHTSADSPALYLRNGFRQSGRLLFADAAQTES